MATTTCLLQRSSASFVDMGLPCGGADRGRRCHTRLEPVYDVKGLDRIVTRVAREIRLLEQALKATNARTMVEAYDQDDGVLGELT